MLSPLTIRPHCAQGSVFTGKLRFARATRHRLIPQPALSTSTRIVYNTGRRWVVGMGPTQRDS